MRPDVHGRHPVAAHPVRCPATIEALADEDVLVVVSTGGTPLPGPLPDNVRVADLLPHDQLLPKCVLMVTNGGYGGVNLALRARAQALAVEMASARGTTAVVEMIEA